MTDDPIYDAERFWDERDDLSECPVCDLCGERIPGDWYEDEGKVICPDCIDEYIYDTILADWKIEHVKRK